jgi:site-specific recombinase XerD
MDSIHNEKHNLELFLTKIKEANSITKTNKDLILEFYNECCNNKDILSDHRILFYLSKLWKLAQIIDKSFDRMTKNDIKELITKIEGKDYEEWTKQGYRVTIKKFFQWLIFHNKKDYEWKYSEYPDKVKFIKTGMKKNNEDKDKKKGNLLTPEDIKELVNVCKNERDKALVWVMFDSGCRIGELLGMNYGDVSFDEDGYCWISVTGKTGFRNVLLVPSSIHLKRWLDQHPTKKNSDSLWCCLASNYHHSRLSYRHVRLLLLELKEKAKLDKPVNPHNFRHSEATITAQHLTEAQSSMKHGWVQGSSMPRTYFHLSGKDTKDAILRMYGKTIKQDKGSILEIIKCIRCNHENPPEKDFCEQCNLPLTQKAMLKVKEEKEKQQKELIELIVKSGVMDKLVEQKVKELEQNKTTNG